MDKVGITGAGKMGTAIFNYLLDFNFELVWVCSERNDVEKIRRQFSRRIKRWFDTAIIDQVRYETLTKTIITIDLNELRDCDLIIEAITENLGLKKELFLKLDKIVKPGAVFSSNSSSINPSEMAPPGRRAGQFAGLHFFYPVALKNIVEFTVTPYTTGDTRASIGSFLSRINRCFITLSEQNSFMLNKIFLDFQNEAFLMVQSGSCTFMQMDQLVKKHFFPFGVFDFCDSVGLDTMLASICNYTLEYPDKLHYMPLISFLKSLTAAGKTGVKSQEGFYKYPLEEITLQEPADAVSMVDHLRNTWLSSAKRFTLQANIPLEDANHAIREYFDLARGPFD